MYKKSHKKITKDIRKKADQKAKKLAIIEAEKLHIPTPEEAKEIENLLTKKLASFTPKTEQHPGGLKTPRDLTHIIERIHQQHKRLGLSYERIIQDIGSLFLNNKDHPDLYPEKNYSIIMKKGEHKLIASIYLNDGSISTITTFFYWIDPSTL